MSCLLCELGIKWLVRTQIAQQFTAKSADALWILHCVTFYFRARAYIGDARTSILPSSPHSPPSPPPRRRECKWRHRRAIASSTWYVNDADRYTEMRTWRHPLEMTSRQCDSTAPAGLVGYYAPPTQQLSNLATFAQSATVVLSE